MIERIRKFSWLILALVAAYSVSQAGAQSRGRAGAAGSPLTYFIADGTGKPGFRSTDAELARWALDDWSRSAAGSIRYEPAPEAAALIRIYWAAPLGGEYGETRAIMAGGQRGADVYVRPDVNALGPELAVRARTDPLWRETVVYLTCVHEIGHALGLDHTRDFRDIMYYFVYGGDIVEYFGRYRARLTTRDDIAKVSGLSASDEQTLKGLYAPR